MRPACNSILADSGVHVPVFWAEAGHLTTAVNFESMQSCGVITLRPRPGAVPRLAGNPGANVEMRFPRCHSAPECEHRGNSGQCARSVRKIDRSVQGGPNV